MRAAAVLPYSLSIACLARGRHAAATGGGTYMSAPVQGCQIFLVIETGGGARERLAAAIAVAPIASVLFRLTGPSSAAATAAATLKPLVEFAQEKGVAALVADDASLARTLRADGVHLGPGADLLKRYDAARDILGKGAIVGVDAGGSRHLAMEAGEAGADYIAFGASQIAVEPVADESENETSEEAAPEAVPVTTEGLVAWWSEIFEVPCVALDGGTLDELQQLIGGGADFIGVDIKAGRAAGDITALLGSLDLATPSGAGKPSA